MKEILDDIGQNHDLKKDLLKGRQVDLAEELSESLFFLLYFFSSTFLFSNITASIVLDHYWKRLIVYLSVERNELSSKSSGSLIFPA